MTPETLLCEAAELIVKANECGILRVHVCIFDDHLQVLAQSHTTKPHHVFFKLTSSHLQNGLSPKEWEQLKNQLWDYYTETFGCQKL